MTPFYRAIFWTTLILALVMALLPPPSLPGAPSDKIQHIIAFWALAALAAAAYRSISLIRLFIALSAFGALIEVLQTIPDLSRDGDPVDWLADNIAVAMVFALIWWRRSKQASSS